jgi:hypothetical protein
MAGGAGQIDGVLIHEMTRSRFAATAGAIEITGTLDPQVGIGMWTSCRSGRRSAQCSAAGVAPVEFGVGRRAGAAQFVRLGPAPAMTTLGVGVIGLKAPPQIPVLPRRQRN